LPGEVKEREEFISERKKEMERSIRRTMEVPGWGGGLKITVGRRRGKKTFQGIERKGNEKFEGEIVSESNEGLYGTCYDDMKKKNKTIPETKVGVMDKKNP